MSFVVDIRDRLNAIMVATLPAYQKLPDNYQTSDNPMPIAPKAYAIGFGAGENITDEWCNLGKMRIRRQFQAVMTNIYMPNLDADYRDGLEDALLDDQFAFIAAVEKDPTLTAMDVSSRYTTDNGLEYLIDEEKQFIIIVMTLTVDYFEETA